MSDVLVVAPWTPEQVSALNAWQKNPRVHPYTCGNRGHGHEFRLGDYGVLIATRDGLECFDCGYQQTWAHWFTVRAAAVGGVTPEAPQ